MTPNDTATAALATALDGAMATAGMAVMPSHYTRHVLTRLTEQGWHLSRTEPLTVEHQPGDYHRYGPLVCEICGQHGNLTLSVEPQRAALATAGDA